jgi:hypothetical protein
LQLCTVILNRRIMISLILEGEDKEGLRKTIGSLNFWHKQVRNEDYNAFFRVHAMIMKDKHGYGTILWNDIRVIVRILNKKCKEKYTRCSGRKERKGVHGGFSVTVQVNTLWHKRGGVGNSSHKFRMHEDKHKKYGERLC